MAPPYGFDATCCGSAPVASNWDPCMIRDICNGGCSSPPPSMGCCFPPIGSCNPARANVICATPARDPCKLPPINCVANRICNDHPRDDCCRVPMCNPSPCNPCVRPCAPALCAERVRPIKRAETYEPPCQPFDGCSLYRTQFSGCYGPPATSFKPTMSYDPPSARMSGTSLYREQFTCKYSPVERRTVKEEYSPSCSPFEGCSTYRVDYNGCYGRPAELMKPPTTYDQSSGRMDGTTTYRNEFIPYCPAEYQYARGINKKPEETSQMSCSPFSGCSTYRVDFPPKCSAKQPSMKPLDRSGFSTAPFCNCTTYKTDYPPFYFKDICPDDCIRVCR